MTPGLIATPARYSGAPTPVSSSGIPTAASLGAPTPASSSATLTTASLGAPTTATYSGTPTTITLGAPTADNSSSSTPTTDIDNTSLGSPPAAFTSKKDNAVSTTAEVHAESTEETTEELEIVKTVEREETPQTEANLAVMQALGWPKKSTTTPSSTTDTGATTITPTASTAVSFISNLPPLPVLPTAPNFNFPTVSAGTAAATSSTPSQIPIQQSVVSVEGQNVLVSGAGPVQVAGRSMRWGRVLKGCHNYFCF